LEDVERSIGGVGICISADAEAHGRWFVVLFDGEDVADAWLLDAVFGLVNGARPF
jgi:hypothetical protein